MKTEKTKRVRYDTKLKAEREFWVQKLSREFGESNLRPDFERAADGPGPEEIIRFSIPEPLHQKVVRVTDNSDLLCYTLMMAILKICLHKYTGSNSIVVGSPPCRIDEDDDLQNVLVIADEIDSRRSFREFLLSVQQNLKECYSHQSYPFDRLLDDLGVDRSSGRSHLFDIALAFENVHTELPELSNDITIILGRSADGLTGRVKFRSDLFEPVTIRRFIGHLLVLLEGALENADTPVANLQMLSAPELSRSLIEWNDSWGDLESGRCLHTMFEARAVEIPDAVALNFEEQHLSFGVLNRCANQLAHYLRSVGAGPEVIVGVCMERSIEAIIALLGALKAGAGYMPMDPRLPQDRLLYMLRDAHAPVVLTQERFVGLLLEDDFKVLCLDTQWYQIVHQSEETPLSGVTGENLAYVIYTSGTTGRPKGVSIEHSGACNLVVAQIKAFELSRNDRVLQFASLGFDASVSEIFTSLIAGSNLDLGEETPVYSGVLLTQQMRKRAITTVTLPPSILAETEPDEAPALHTLIVAGEKCLAETAARWSPGRLFINAFGPTEVTVCACLFRTHDSVSWTPPIGRPLSNKTIYLLDSHLMPVPQRVKGELFVGGVGLARCYAGRGDLTAEKFLPDPFTEIPGARIYKSGDLASYLADGKIMFGGRLDHQVKIRGYRIELGEIEQVLMEHLEVRQAVVTAYGDERNRLAAYVIPVDGVQVTVTELRAHLQEILPEYMTPSNFVFMEAFPLTSNGKVDRGKLPPPDRNRHDLENQFVAPRSELESGLAAIFAKALEIDRIGIFDNFFELGGHSMLAVQLMARVRETYNIDLPVGALFDAPTVAELAVTIVQCQLDEVDAEVIPELLNRIEMLSEEEALSSSQAR